MSDPIDSSQFDCVCGLQLRIPSIASTKAKSGNCPKCQTRFEYFDGEWFRVAVNDCASTALVAVQSSHDQLPTANLDSVPAERNAANDSQQTVQDVSTESTHRASSLDNQSNRDDAFLKEVSGCKIAQRYMPDTFSADGSHLRDDVISRVSDSTAGREDLPKQDDDRERLLSETNQHKISCRRLNTEGLEETPSLLKIEQNPKPYSYRDEVLSSSTKTQKFDRSPQTMVNSLAPNCAAERFCDSLFENGLISAPLIDSQTIDSQPATEGPQTGQSDPKNDKNALVGECKTAPRLLTNQKIRESLALSLGLDMHFPESVVAAITLACHPWPDREVSQTELDSISAELRPGYNINHPSILEVAIDRLFRFSEALRFQGSTALASCFTKAAFAIESYSSKDSCGKNRDNSMHNRGLELIAAPICLGTSKLKTRAALSNDLPPSEPNSQNDWAFTIISLQGAAVFRGSPDTGIALDSEATGVSVSCLAEKLGVELPEKKFDEYLDKLDSRTLDILTSRTFKLGLPDTLEDIAVRWNISRERVRQIETKASDNLHNRFSETFKRFGKKSISPLINHVFRIDILHAIATRISQFSRHRELLAGFCADIFGPWQRTGHWIFQSSLQSRVEQLLYSLPEKSSRYGIIAGDAIEIGCEGLFLSPKDRDQYLKDVLGLGNYFGVWTNKKTLRCQVAAALCKIGRPATKEEIADLLNHPMQSIGSIMANIEGIVRADRYRWGFNEWVEDAYDGIYGEIEQRINEYNGSVPVHIIMGEIPAQFDVAESSVKAYLASSAFVVDNGMVRMANKEEYVPRSPSRCADAIRIGDRWGYRTLIHDRHFNGYSLGINFDIAYVNGLRPGDDLVVPVDGCDEEVSLIWRAHNLNRLVDVGRVANYLLARGYNAGETLILIPSRDKIEIIHERDLNTRLPELDFQLRFDTSGTAHDINEDGSDGDLRDPLFDLLAGEE